jgi:hypothetical protein
MNTHSCTFIEKSLKKCGISNELNATENYYLQGSSSDYMSSADDDDETNGEE